MPTKHRTNTHIKTLGMLIIAYIMLTDAGVPQRTKENITDNIRKENNFAAQPEYNFNNLKKVFKFISGHTQNKAKSMLKIPLFKYIQHDEIDQNTLSAPEAIDNEFTKEVPLALNGDIVFDTNLWKFLPLKEIKNKSEQNINNEFTRNQKLRAENKKHYQYMEDITNTSTNFIKWEYNGVNANFTNYKFMGRKYLHPNENITKRKMRRASEYRNKNISYQSLCPTKRTPIALETTEFEYRPNHYIEVSCAHNYVPTHTNTDDKNKICSEAGFSCMQLNRTMHLIRRNKSGSNECWESEIRVVPSGCECMWPKHYYGDILAYHESHKRYNTGEISGYIPFVSKNNS